MNLPTAILIDLDDTILDDSGCTESSWTDACAAAAIQTPALDAQRLQAVIKECATVWWSDPERHRLGRLDLRPATIQIVTEALTRLDHDPALAPAIANHYRNLRDERPTLLEGAVETLEWLRSNGVRLGMMTNGAGPAQRAKIERFDLARHFDHIIIEGEFGVGKPDRRVFETLLQELNATPATTWAIGDNISADVYGAMDLGIHGIWIDPQDRMVPVDWREPDRIVRSLSELRSS